MKDHKTAHSSLTVSNNSSALATNGTFGVSAETLVQEDRLANALLESHTTILQRIMPSQADRENAKFHADRARLQATSRLDFFQKYKAFQSQSLKDSFDSLLMRGKTSLRGENAEFFAHHYKDLAARIAQLSEEFLNEFGAKLEEAETTKIEFIKQKKIDMLTKRIEQFTVTVELLMERFTEIPTEGV